MKLVLIESPYAASGRFSIEDNLEYAKLCVIDCLERGESPYASHLFFTQPGILNDFDPSERPLGIEAGLAWGDKADMIAVYIDHGISKGMLHGLIRHFKTFKKIEIRSLERAVTYLDKCSVYLGAAVHAAKP